jgi:integrase/recombinase XerD
MRTRTPSSVGVRGPLAGYAAGFIEELRARGYTEVSAWHQLHLCAQVSRWLEAAGPEPAELTDAAVRQFLRARREAAPTGPRTERALAPLLGYLRRLGVVPEPVAARAEGELERLIERYRHYLVRERGLAARTVVGYEATTRLFLTGRMSTEGLDLAGLGGADVTRFVLRESRRRNVGSAKYLVTGLRSLLRFLHLEGAAPALAEAVPTVAGWRGAALPRALDPRQVAQLLASGDLGTAIGRRDHAMLTLLVRLGLRAGEVAALRLDDVDWRRGELVIRGKGDRQERLPLPADVGEALSAYLVDGRPPVGCRRLFLRARAPFDVGLTSGGVQSAVRLACARTGITPAGAHRLRHTAATELLRAGASLTEVAQVLRHRSLATSTIYAQVDRVALRALARPWPGGAA